MKFYSIILINCRCVVFLQTFKIFEKLAEEDRERASGRLEECKSAPPAVQELEVQSEQEAEAPVEERSTEESTAVTASASETGEETPHSSHAEPTGDTQPATSNSDPSAATAYVCLFETDYIKRKLLLYYPSV